ncbi:cardiolipin synthase [Microbacterium sp. APC 3898]|uniref:Cardiolipin synthase n=2 Tax=Planococcus TaxID=1372 RepID=A0ABT7ZM79_9BACL|nr:MULTISPECIES: cardiolipin synthase [Terrabacteria group]MBF6633441.1 cardiolipin synthase [Planococcus sp. (in: firmicutes)]MBD8015371.1 cardiolipin synthase [Planococcus wigleyi]MDN3428259.1 cardiolipin synthase [Planococcus sp. APC 4016]MDN3439422.1 cardiolipin synthase [Planococcus sp. APC 3900]MDN3498203.1 cardiolipin synthase [Microbacterium sp. APC 3898]
MTVTIFSVLTAAIFIFNVILAAALVFLERRDASSTWAWLLVLFFIPILGFFIYLLLGRQLRKKTLFKWEGSKRVGIEHLIATQMNELHDNSFEFQDPNAKNYTDLVYLHLRNNGALLTQDNNLQIFNDGRKKFNSLLQDIENATDHIHIQYYIFRLDELGNRIVDALTLKAKEGVKVRLLYDDMGSRRISKRLFKKLTAAGGEVETFFPSILPIINPRLNYRNHRKIVVIDGDVGYLGGFNVGDEYLGLSRKFGYWRDTHLRITGSALYPLQTRFIRDWNQASARHDIEYDEAYFPVKQETGNTSMQIVSSGPDEEWEQIKDGYLKLINLARDYIYIQTPYFIPDASFYDAIRIAALSGIDVRIMIPNKPDHPFVYWATYSYAGQMLRAGARVFIYDNGFLHTKMIVTDNKASTVGTANIDVRSFKLNFEVNAFIYDEKVSTDLAELFHRDMKLSTELTYMMYLDRTRMIKTKESIARLLAPIL